MSYYPLIFVWRTPSYVTVSAYEHDNLYIYLSQFIYLRLVHNISAKNHKSRLNAAILKRLVKRQL